jgi:hypothetical protein
MIFTRKFTFLVAVEAVGFTGAIAMLFTSVPFWVAATLWGFTLGFVLTLAAKWGL